MMLYFTDVVSSTTDNCTHGDIRLLNGTVPSEGRVEVCIEGIWGTVADDFWDNRDARVVCGQLGYSTRCKCIIYSEQLLSSSLANPEIGVTVKYPD